MKKQYASYQQTINLLEHLVDQHPNLLKMHSIGNTWEGRPIVMVTMTIDVEKADEKPALLYTGTIHAREWIGNELAVKFIQYATENYQVNPQLIKTLKNNTLYMVPCLNPDGFEYSRTHFSFWRKNRRDNGDGTFGVDLNRNFAVRFKRGPDTSLNTYSGPEAFSEPETSAIRDFVESHSNITVSLDYHSQGNVFFPAHKFNHESEIEGTDLNVLCANMNREIEKVTGRLYGIHRGKPPANLIHGSGREYYYSRGILATVVEVGTRNIPDYLSNMTQSVDENIPAVQYALSEAINYSSKAPKRVSNFTTTKIDVFSASLSWDYEQSDDVYFEIYRSEKVKSACREENIIGITKNLHITDVQLKSGQKYYYNIRAVNRKTDIKSPFAPEVKIKTLLSEDEFSRYLFPAKKDVGYVGQYTQERNREHFGLNSLFVGVNKSRGICYGVVMFSLENIPDDAKIKSVKFCLYPMNRVNAKIENFGEWTVSLLDSSTVSDITNFDEIHNATPLQTLSNAITSDKLTQGMWTEWPFNVIERRIVKEHISSGKFLLRIDGPNKLPLGADSQMMQFDIGYGRFGGGIHYRPNLDIIYSTQPQEARYTPASVTTFYKTKTVQREIKTGFDEQGNRVFGYMSFEMTDLPDPHKFVITDAYLELQNANTVNSKRDTRYTIELADNTYDSYESISSTDNREYVGYEVSNLQLKEKTTHHFIFDSYCKQKLEALFENRDIVQFIIRTTASSEAKNSLVSWFDNEQENIPNLVIKYIERRKHGVEPSTQLSAKTEGKVVKLTWTNPIHADFVGTFVVRNRFHPPKSPSDGVKIYAGKDEYTYDNFGNPNVPKYYSVFSYDDVPNFSSPNSIYFASDETIQIEEEEYEGQGEDDIN